VFCSNLGHCRRVGKGSPHISELIGSAEQTQQAIPNWGDMSLKAFVYGV
jgi:hypothetical protein